MWSAALDAILTTLRYLAPATLLTLFWGQQSFLFKLLKHIDSAFRAIVFSSEEQKQSVLQWLAEAGGVRVERLDTVWRHGWVVCGALDAALPGACAGHAPTRLSLQHAQAIADHYLGVEPVFSRQELESNDSLSKHQEWKLATYLDRIRLALAKLTPPVSKPGSQRTSPETSQFTLDYVARGSGLAAAQVNNKMYFKVYPTAQQSLDPGEITILIRGPKDTYGMKVLPPLLGKAQLIRQKLLGLQTKPNYTENILPITQGATYLRSYGKNDMNKTFYIPKTKYDIEIEADTRSGSTKISYVVNLEGRYEISITSRGQNIVGSPFSVSASRNIISILENESFCLEDGEEIDIVDIKTDRKVVLRIVDFVTEKMLLKENGTLEKITADEAKMLMTTENNDNKAKYIIETNITHKSDTNEAPIKNKINKLKTTVQKVVLISRVCKVFSDLLEEKKSAVKKENQFIRPRSLQDIPDIVNSTLNESNHNPFVMSDVRDKYIIPENISVSLRTEKSHEEEVLREHTPELISATNKIISENFADEIHDGKLISFEEQEEDDILMVITSSPGSCNPFLVDTYEDSYVTEKKLGTFVPSEYETNNSQNEETSPTPIKIIIDEHSPSPISPNKNPFIDSDTVELERPKTPVLKIITGEVKDRDDSVYVDPKAEEMLGNEFINPFFVHQHLQTGLNESLPSTDFIIGAPVSLPPVIRASSPASPIDSLIITADNENIAIVKPFDLIDQNEKSTFSNEESKSEFSTPLHTNVTPNCKMDTHSANSSTFHSLESENIEIINIPDSKFEPLQIEVLQCKRNISPKKEIWDSAYVSIDENNSSPDSNNNESACDLFGLKHDDLTNMGPAERELWQTCNELKEDVCKANLEEVRPNRWEIRKPLFTPIIEESDRSLSSGIKDMRVETSQSKSEKTDPITVAFAELNDMYHDYFPNSETESTETTNEENKLQSLEVDYTINGVDSASETIADVKRHTNELEGKISEVQANVTESFSVSQTLQTQHKTDEDKGNDETQFGDRNRTNIVLEKKKYWDDRIRQIEAKSQEMTTQQKKRRYSSKQLRHNDSLTKRRGKQIVKNFLSAGDLNQTTPTPSPDNKYNEISNEGSPTGYVSLDDTRSDVKLVDKWKKYWDEKLETEKSDMENSETEITCFRVKSPKTKIQAISQQYMKKSVEDIKLLEDKSDDYKIKSASLPVKQELPEEVFKAFETSPKRFFGTSRKQILNKIDTFLGKPSTVDKLSEEESGASHDSGLVSSRISLFHSISHTEEIPSSRTKSKSLHNIRQRKDSEKGSGIVEEIKETAGNTIESILAAKFEKIDTSKGDSVKVSSLREKRSRIASNAFNKSFDETVSTAHAAETKQIHYVQRTVKDMNKQSSFDWSQKYKKTAVLRRKSFSKSEMDIFNKATSQPTDDGLDKYKSCDELPKINVKNFISLFEGVSKTSVESKPVPKISKMSSNSHFSRDNAHTGAVSKPLQQIQHGTTEYQVEDSSTDSPSLSSRRQWTKSFESVSSACTDAKSSPDSIDIEIISNQDKETTHLSLSDIELEIVESSPDKSSESSPQDPEPEEKDYKSRFKLAKQYFQSLEELTEVPKPRKLNECEQLLKNKSTSTESTESLDKDRPKKRVKKNIKSHSMPSSEISKIWSQLQDQSNEAGASKLVKISEKFNVDDLFTDVMEGKLSRQGSLRGIPHKKAVLEAFRSMENISDTKISPYEIAVSQLNDFAKENQIKNAQTYLTEYPYLPTTDPSKYHSRLDAKATGLISFKELIDKRPRRNSVPDLRLNPTFTVDL
ncbi:hypothetical protein ABMA27_001622 [Loxostege sticticalis]|uniref:Uncharacterized protein n=1 Tax=Loxostege sticticalis TaxID=481309 RepID=A0ABR3HZ48_LOXSC